MTKHERYLFSENLPCSKKKKKKRKRKEKKNKLESNSNFRRLEIIYTPDRE